MFRGEHVLLSQRFIFHTDWNAVLLWYWTKSRFSGILRDTVHCSCDLKSPAYNHFLWRLHLQPSSINHYSLPDHKSVLHSSKQIYNPVEQSQIWPPVQHLDVTSDPRVSDHRSDWPQKKNPLKEKISLRAARVQACINAHTCPRSFRSDIWHLIHGFSFFLTIVEMLVVCFGWIWSVHKCSTVSCYGKRRTGTDTGWIYRPV